MRKTAPQCWLLLLVASISTIVATELTQVITGIRTYCDNEPCKNGGVCRMLEGDENARSFTCECQPGWAGALCDIPTPTLNCGTNKITVTIDKRLVEHNDLDKNEALISFLDDTNKDCTAKLEGDHYKLSIKSPFGENCGTKSSRDEHDDYIFGNEVIWKKQYTGQKGEAPIQRRITLVDFKCDYEDEYLLSINPIKPAESVIEQKTAKGNFIVDMQLFKNALFSMGEGRYSDRPIIRIEQQVCVKLSLKNQLGMSALVLTAANCWASSVPSPTEEQKHYIIEKKCKSDAEYSVDIIANGMGNDVKFCFQLFKWKEDFDQAYLQCEVSICDSSVNVRGLSQCRCPPKSFDINSWFYPNYYDIQFKHYNTYGYDGMYADDASAYGNGNENYYYQDYLGPMADFEKRYGKRKRRSIEDTSDDATPELEGEAATEDSAPEQEQELALDTSNLPRAPAKDSDDAEPQRKRGRPFVDIRRDEDGKLILPEGVSIDPPEDMMNLVYGPILVRPATNPDEHKEALATIHMHEIDDKGEWFENPETADNIVLIAVGGSLIFAMIILGVVIGVYVQFRNAANQKAQKSFEDQHKVREFYQGVLKTGNTSESGSSEKGGKAMSAFVRAPE